MVSAALSSLIVTPAPGLSAAAIVQAIQTYGLDASQTSVITQAVYEPTSRGQFGHQPKSLLKVVSIVPENGSFFHSAENLTKMAALVAPGGNMICLDLSSASSTELISRNLLMAGLVEATPFGAAMTASKPNWEVGATFSLKKPTPQAPKPATAVNTWKLAMDMDGEEMVDEDELLTEADLVKPDPAAAEDDCEVGAAGRKACKNCNCGRAEGKIELTEDMLDNPQNMSGGCGSCALGDAFRCASCPYLGKPSFKEGEKIVMDVTEADI